MNLRLAAAVMAGRGAGLVARRLGRGGGTAIPGVVAMKMDPGLLGGLGRQLGGGRVLVTGTNGKTTTTRMLAGILEAAGVPFVHNREGSNLVRGMASTLLSRADLLGRVAGAATQVGLFEVDEATLPAAAAALAPSTLTFTNLFRDQLDRYGEVDTVFAFWEQALQRTPQTATLVLNADDPSVAELALSWHGPIHWFGVDDASLVVEGGPDGDGGEAFDARWCRRCGGTFAYDERYFAHVGHWRCAGCGRVRARPDTLGADVRIGADRAAFTVGGLGAISMPLTGLYNVYNALAAIATARVLGLPASAITAGLEGTRPAFGRQEAIVLAGRRLRLMLCKNPAGANQVFRLLASVAAGDEHTGQRDGRAAENPNAATEGKTRDVPNEEPAAPSSVAVLLNDRFADGQDVSWVWDVDYEPVARRIARCWVGGDRAEDMALRLEYARWPRPLAVEHDPAALLDAIVRDTREAETVAVVATYTAMLDLRAELTRRGAAGHFWEEA